MDSDSQFGIKHWVIYKNPSDYPNKYVVRCLVAVKGEVLADMEPTTVVDTLEAARARVPDGTVMVARHPSDDPVIVEVWL